VEETWILPSTPPGGERQANRHAGENTREKNKTLKGDSIVKKRLLKVAVTTALTVAFAVPAFANPFADVPAKHWAYDAVNKLAQAGVVDGYGDGTFRGDKTVTRYEMAQIIAKAMTKSVNADQKETLDKLSKEFGTELTTLGVKVDGLQDQVDKMVKISGDARVRYGAVEDNSDNTDFRARVSFDGKINDDMKFNARVTSGNIAYDDSNSGIKLDTANVSFNALGLNTTIGRQDVKLGSGFLMDTQMNAVAAKAGDLKLFGGNTSYKANASDTSNTKERFYGAEYKHNILGANVTADYLKNDTQDTEVYGANATFGIAKNVSAVAEYFKQDDLKAQAYGVKFDKVGLSVMHRDVDAGIVNAYSNITSDINSFGSVALKGMEYQYDRALGKNAVLTVKHQDFDNLDAHTNAYVNVKF